MHQRAVIKMLPRRIQIPFGGWGGQDSFTDAVCFSLLPPPLRRQGFARPSLSKAEIEQWVQMAIA